MTAYGIPGKAFPLESSLNAISSLSNSGIGRPVLLGFGCSISQMDQPLPHTTTTTVSGETKAGATSLNVVSGSSFTNGDKVLIVLYDARLWKTTITVSGNVITPATATPQLIRSGASVTKYTYPVSADLDLPINMVRGATQLLGGSVEVVSGYGYGGAQAGQMCQDFVKWFNYYRPAICVFSLFENDLTGAASGITSTAQLKGFARFVSRYCLQYGCVPVVLSSVPFASIPSNRCADYDEMARWVVNDLPNEVPGARGSNVSTQWLDTTVPTARGPLAGWTDGVHPNVDHRWSVAQLAGVPALQGLLPTPRSLLDYCLTPRTNSGLEGTGGSGGTLQGGSVIPANWTFSKFGSVATISSSRNADGSIKILCLWPAGVARDRNTDYGFFRYSYTFPDAWAGSGNYYRGYARVKIIQNTTPGISHLAPSVAVTSGETYFGYSGSGSAICLPVSNDIICIETPEFTLGPTQTIITSGIVINPVTDATPASDAIFEFDLYELGVIPAVAPFPI